MADTGNSEVLGVRALEEQYGYSEATQRKGRNEGDVVPHFLVGNRIRYRRAAVEAYIADQEKLARRAQAATGRGGPSSDAAGTDGGCSREVDAGAPEHTRDGVSGQGSAATGPQSGAVPSRPVGDAEAARKQPRLTGPREAPGVADPVKADMPELPVTRRQFIRVPQR